MLQGQRTVLMPGKTAFQRFVTDQPQRFMQRQ
jgi:hypothetical protein